MTIKSVFTLLSQEIAKITIKDDEQHDKIQHWEELSKQQAIKKVEYKLAIKILQAQIYRYDNPHVGTNTETYSRIKQAKDEESKMNRESCNIDKNKEDPNLFTKTQLGYKQT